MTLLYADKPATSSTELDESTAGEEWKQAGTWTPDPTQTQPRLPHARATTRPQPTPQPQPATGPRSATKPRRQFLWGYRPHRVFWMLLIIWILSAADLGFTVWAHRFTPFVEGNPIAAKLLDMVPRSLSSSAFEYSPVIALKLITLIIGTTFIWPLRKHRSAELGLWVLLITLGYLMVMWNSYTKSFIQDHRWVQVSNVTDPGQPIRADNSNLTQLDNK